MRISHAPTAGLPPRAFLPVTVLLLAPWPLAAQRSAAAPAAAQAAGPSLKESAELDAIKSVKWRAIGPSNQAGRIPVVVGMPGDRSTYYVGSAAGGLIKTTNGGVTFTQLFDDKDNASMGDLVVAPSDPNILYLGTGEGNPRNSASIGDGVYKSLDAGRTWRKIGLENVEKIPRMRIDPRNPDIVYVCALGRTWGPNDDRGLYKTSDGGKTWEKILYKDSLTGCSDVDIDPNNANIVYAGMYTHQRWPWYFT
ncbi:MAG: glycosyl hydrolase, partial [Gemmatimonadaceae bacterium]